MKRLLVLILSITYLATTSGASIDMHFCNGKFADWSLWFKGQEKSCGKCGMEKSEEPNGCCSDESKWVKIKDDQKASVALFEFLKSPVAEPLHDLSFNHHLFLVDSGDLLPQSHAPPRTGSIAIYKRNCIYLI